MMDTVPYEQPARVMMPVREANRRARRATLLTANARERRKAKSRFTDLNEPAPKPSECGVLHLAALAKSYPGIAVQPVVRVSSPNQGKKGNLEEAARELETVLEGLNVRAVGPAIRLVAKGWASDLQAQRKAAATAKQRGAQVLVFMHANRALRAIYCNRRPDAQPSRQQWTALLDACDMKIATVVHSDEHWAVVRGQQTKRGLVAKNAKCGRPRNHESGHKKRLRLACKPRVLALHAGKGKWSYRDMSCLTGIPFSTVRVWILESKS